MKLMLLLSIGDKSMLMMFTPMKICSSLMSVKIPSLMLHFHHRLPLTLQSIKISNSSSSSSPLEMVKLVNDIDEMICHSLILWLRYPLIPQRPQPQLSRKFSSWSSSLCNNCRKWRTRFVSVISKLLTDHINWPISCWCIKALLILSSFWNL